MNRTSVCAGSGFIEEAVVCVVGSACVVHAAMVSALAASPTAHSAAGRAHRGFERVKEPFLLFKDANTCGPTTLTSGGDHPPRDISNLAHSHPH